MCSSLIVAITEWTPSVIASLLSSCTKQRCLNIGRAIHANIIRRDWWWSRHVYLHNHLINLYAKCHEMECARHVFEEMPKRNTVSWTALISGYDQCGRPNKALEMFSLMVSEESHGPPNQFTYASAITACAKQQGLGQGMQLHCHELKRGFHSSVLVQNVLISLYMCFGLVTEAELVFEELEEPDQVSWNSLISGLSQNGFLKTTLKQFQKMRQSGERVTSFALSAVISACLEGEIEGKILHGLAAKLGLDSESFTSCSMIHMYSKFKNMGDAVKVFQDLEFKDVASLNSLIEGYAEIHQGEDGLHVFSNLMKYGQKPDDITMTSLLGICSNLVILEYGRQIHSLSTKLGLDQRIRVQNSIIDMYSKCGILEDGLKIFSHMKERTLVSWTSMIGGLANHGRAKHAVELLEEMKKEGLKPNKVTYTCVLSACSHGGLFDDGFNVFNSMEIEPEIDHLVCIMHILVGTGRFEEAKEIIQRAKSEDMDLLWQTFLIACKNGGEWEKGIEVAEKIMKAGLFVGSSSLVLLSNIFAAVGKWEEAGMLREEIRERKMKKEPGCSWIEASNDVVRVYGINI